MTFTQDPPAVGDISLIPNADEKADLDAPASQSGKVVVSQVPNISISSTTVVADAAERLALDVQEGDVAIQTNVSSSFIFTGGDNIAPNWEVLDFDAVGAISGEDIAPNDINALGDILGQSIDVTTVNGADTSAASAGEALTSDGSGNLSFASVGGIEEVATFGNLPTIDPPQLAYVTGNQEYYYSRPVTGTPFDITSSEFSLETTINSEDGRPEGIAWNNDGTRLYEVGDESDEIYQSTVSTPFDIATASFSTSINAQASNPRGIAWNNDGSELYECGRFRIYEYDLSNPFDLSTATHNNIEFEPSREPLEGMAWNDDGFLLYTVTNEFSNATEINQYTLSAPFDITSPSLSSSISTQDANPRGIAWNNDGSRLYEVGQASDKIYEYSVSTPFDIATASFQTSINTQGNDPEGIAWNNDGSRLYEIDSAFENIHQFTLTTGGWEAF